MLFTHSATNFRFFMYLQNILVETIVLFLIKSTIEIAFTPTPKPELNYPYNTHTQISRFYVQLFECFKGAQEMPIPDRAILVYEHIMTIKYPAFRRGQVFCHINPFSQSVFYFSTETMNEPHDFPPPRTILSFRLLHTSYFLLHISTQKCEKISFRL